MSKKKAPAGNNGAARRGAKKKAKKLEIRSMPIRRRLPTDSKAVYSNHIVIRHDLSSFQLFFFDLQPPIVLKGDSEEWKAEVAAQKSIDANCIARVAIPHHIMPDLIRALQTNLESHEAVAAQLREHGVTTLEELKDMN